MFKNLKRHWKNHPILRNLELIIGFAAILVFLGLVASFGKFIVDWVLSFGVATWVTIGITALVCGILFGIIDAASNKKEGAGEYSE